MQSEDYKKFSEILGGVHDFYARDLSEFALSLWWRALQRYDLSAIQKAFDRHLMNPDTGQFLPKPGDITRMLGGRSQDSAHLAWAKVDEGIRKVGTYATVVFDDPLIHRVIHDMGGWTRLGTKSEEEWPFVANEFRTRYQGYRLQGEIPEYPPKLIGIAEHENAHNGFTHSQIVMIGDANKAKRIHASGSNKPILTLKNIDAATLLVSEHIANTPQLRAVGE